VSALLTSLMAFLSPFGLGLLNMSNPCVLPLYPGFLAYLAGNQQVLEKRALARWLGLITLLGLLTAMLVLGFALALLQIEAGKALAVLLPITYAIVISMGVLLILNVNLLARLSVVNIPRLRNPILGSFLYGVLYAPVTLPCSSTLLIGVFANAASITDALDGIRYFLLFGLGFGLPLLVLPLLADPVRKSIIKWMTDHTRSLARLSGVVLIMIGVIGLITNWELIRYYWAF
jgi:cytochrome c-type biogenesis protein